jgi:hypothetical protein
MIITSKKYFQNLLINPHAIITDQTRFDFKCQLGVNFIKNLEFITLFTFISYQPFYILTKITHALGEIKY